MCDDRTAQPQAPSQQPLPPPYLLIHEGLRRGRIIPFLGAGASLGARPPKMKWNHVQGAYLPKGDELAEYLAQRTAFPPDEPSDDLAKVSQYYSERRDGKRLATGSRDKTAKVWDAATGKELLSLSGHSEGVHSVAWSPDGNRLATAGEDGIVQVYAMDINDLMALARSRVTRNLTPAECEKYLHVDKCPPIP